MKPENKIIFLLGVMLLGASGAGDLYAQKLYYNGSMQYASGSYYFTESTESLYLMNGFSMYFSRFNMSLNIPFIVQNSPWISYSYAGGIPTGGPQHGSLGPGSGHGSGQNMGNGSRRIDLSDTASYTHSGFGDPAFSAGYRLFSSEDGAMSANLNASVKFPFANPSRGFGTGGWDTGIGGSVSQRIDTWFLMANIMYWNFGDMPDLILNNTLSYGAGLGVSFSGGAWMILVSYSGMTEILEGIDPPESVGMNIGYQLNRRISLNVSASVGLSQSSSDIIFGGGWQVNFYS